MNKTLPSNSCMKRRITRVTLARGMGWGLLGGWGSTLFMDFVLMGALSAVGLPALSCFSIVGNTVARFFSLMGLEVAGGVSLGVATHYVVGPVIGIIFGGIVTQVACLRVDSVKKGVILAVLYVEILSQPILATTPILLKMTNPEAWLWFGGSFVMHFIWGTILGLVMGYGFGLATAVKPGCA